MQDVIISLRKLNIYICLGIIAIIEMVYMAWPYLGFVKYDYRNCPIIVGEFFEKIFKEAIRCPTDRGRLVMTQCHACSMTGHL